MVAQGVGVDTVECLAKMAKEPFRNIFALL